jgi:hypothetical protein
MSPKHGMSGLGGSQQARAPRAATVGPATIHCRPRRAWRAATTGLTRLPWTGGWSAGAKRCRRAVGARTARTDAWQPMGGAGVGQTTAASPRSGAGRQVARPVSRRSCRRRQAVSRPVAAWRAGLASARARLRSRMALSAPAGTSPGGRSPARSRRARGAASRRSVLTRSPAWFGISDGAATPPWWPVGVRDRESQEPQGPAASTKSSGVAWAGLVRRRGSRSQGRVPLVPRQVTTARGSGAPSATAIESWWTSMPLDRVRDGRRADLRVRDGSGRRWGTRRFWLLASSPAIKPGGSLPSRKSLCLGG